jgi:hypothetical protein
MFISIEEIHLIYRFPSSPSLMFQFSSHTKKNTNFAGPPPTKRHVPSEDFPQSPHLSMMPCPSPPNKPTCWGCFASSQWRHRPGEIHIGIKKVPGYEENMYPPSYKQCKIIWYNYIYIHIYHNRYKRWSWISQETWWWKGWILQILQRKRIRGWLISLK